MADAERDRAASHFGGLVAYWTEDAAELTNRRRVTQDGNGRWRISHSDFTTTDPTLARAVAAELDRIDPIR